jgi:hypothetical protein
MIAYSSNNDLLALLQVQRIHPVDYFSLVQFAERNFIGRIYTCSAYFGVIITNIIMNIVPVRIHQVTQILSGKSNPRNDYSLTPIAFPAMFRRARLPSSRFSIFSVQAGYFCANRKRHEETRKGKSRLAECRCAMNSNFCLTPPFPSRVDDIFLLVGVKPHPGER